MRPTIRFKLFDAVVSVGQMSVSGKAGTVVLELPVEIGSKSMA